MDERFDFLDEWSNYSVSFERMFADALLGSRDEAFSQAKARHTALKTMVEEADSHFDNALTVRQNAMLMVCRSIAALSVGLAEEILKAPISEEARQLVDRHIAFTADRLHRDAESRVEQFRLDMKRIALVARSMRDENAWDASAALLRARESVEITSSISRDALGRRQHTERFTKLLVRGLGIAILTDTVLVSSDAEAFAVIDFDGNAVRVIERADYEIGRVSLFHPQATRYLLPQGK
ncbi:hypothetical protein [Vreelandella sulfidaeris]|uniref:Uncharacterized protein n=1 Tax=Vreelandella sulfidaeris TaxID=115553 RepID=A0A455U823_9GAMM|nr:hypothetical protein HSBAA_29830 [Halomonas sulfidaeris]